MCKGLVPSIRNGKAKFENEVEKLRAVLWLLKTLQYLLSEVYKYQNRKQMS